MSIIPNKNIGWKFDEVARRAKYHKIRVFPEIGNWNNLIFVLYDTNEKILSFRVYSDNYISIYKNGEKVGEFNVPGINTINNRRNYISEQEKYLIAQILSTFLKDYIHCI